MVVECRRCDAILLKLPTHDNLSVPMTYAWVDMKVGPILNWLFQTVAQLKLSLKMLSNARSRFTRTFRLCCRFIGRVDPALQKPAEYDDPDGCTSNWLVYSARLRLVMFCLLPFSTHYFKCTLVIKWASFTNSILRMEDCLRIPMI